MFDRDANRLREAGRGSHAADLQPQSTNDGEFLVALRAVPVRRRPLQTDKGVLDVIAEEAVPGDPSIRRFLLVR